jgi:hypothetical protein
MAAFAGALGAAAKVRVTLAFVAGVFRSGDSTST